MKEEGKQRKMKKKQNLQATPKKDQKNIQKIKGRVMKDENKM
jgi:hypothetical protein